MALIMVLAREEKGVFACKAWSNRGWGKQRRRADVILKELPRQLNGKILKRK